MNNILDKKYKKYVLILSENYKKLLENSINNKNLSSEEKELVSILNNKHLEPFQRLRRYQQILFVKLNSRARGLATSDRFLNNKYPGSDISDPLSNVNIERPAIKIDKNTQTKFSVAELKRRMNANSPKKTQNVASQAQDDYEQQFVSRFNSPNVEDIFSTPDLRLSSTFREEKEKETEKTSPILIESDEDDIYEDDKLHFDASREKRNVLEQIERLSSGTPDFRNMTFQNLGDPHKRYAEISFPKIVNINFHFI